MTTPRTAFELEDVRLLLLVARVGSIGEAARQVGLSQPSLSRRLSRFERALGLELFERSTGGTHLTDAGRLVHTWAAQVTDAADSFARSVAALRHEEQLRCKVAVSMTVGEHYLPGWLAAIEHRGGHGQVTVQVRNSAEVVELLRSGTVDIGFIESPTVPPGLRRQVVGQDRLIVAVSPGHPWATRETAMSPEDLAASLLLVREEGSGTRVTLTARLAELGLTVANPVVMDSNVALRAAAAAGAGPTVLSERAVRDDVTAGRLTPVTVATLDLVRPLTALWRSETRLSGAAAEILASSLTP